MDASDLLLVGAEVSVAFAGFAGIITTFQFRDRTKINRGQIVGLTLIVIASLMAAWGSVLPLLLSIFRVEDSTLWAICSFLMLLTMCFYMYVLERDLRGVARNKSARLMTGTLHGVSFLIMLSLILNTADLVFHREAGPYVTGILWALAVVGYMFARLLLLPLWKAVRQQEAANPSGAKSS